VITKELKDQRHVTSPMTPHEIRTTLHAQMQRVAEACQGWTVVICSADNEITAIASLLVQDCWLASRSIADLLAVLPSDVEKVVVICDDDLPDGGVVELMRQLREARPAATCRFLAYLPRTMTQPRLEQLLASGCDALCSRSSSGKGTVLGALVQAIQGQQSVDGVFRLQLKRSHRGDEHTMLKASEQELIQLLARGHKAPQIAALKQRRCDTIRRQLSALYRKTGVRDQRGLLAWALAHGVIRPLDLEPQSRPEGSHQPHAAAVGSTHRNHAGDH
jgi:DNA-binding NarL/FixJ family response regulator